MALGNKPLMVHKKYRKEERSLETPIFTSERNCPFSWPASNPKNSLYSHFLPFGDCPRAVRVLCIHSPLGLYGHQKAQVPERLRGGTRWAPARGPRWPTSKNGEPVRRARDPSPPPFLTSSTPGTQIWRRHHATDPHRSLWDIGPASRGSMGAGRAVSEVIFR